MTCRVRESYSVIVSVQPSNQLPSLSDKGRYFIRPIIWSFIHFPRTFGLHTCAYSACRRIWGGGCWDGSQLKPSVIRCTWINPWGAVITCPDTRCYTINLRNFKLLREMLSSGWCSLCKLHSVCLTGAWYNWGSWHWLVVVQQNKKIVDSFGPTIERA